MNSEMTITAFTLDGYRVVRVPPRSCGVTEVLCYGTVVLVEPAVTA